MKSENEPASAGFKVFYSRAPFFFEVHAATEEQLHRKVQDLDQRFAQVESAP